MELIAADDVTLVQFLNANWATIATMVGAVGAAVAAAVTWLARVVWVRIEDYWSKRDKRDATTAIKTDTLIDTLTTHAPKHTVLLEKMVETQSVISNDIKDSHRRDSDLVINLETVKQAAIDLADGFEALGIASPEEREREIRRAMDRARLKLGQRVKPVRPQDRDQD